MKRMTKETDTPGRQLLIYTRKVGSFKMGL